MIIYFIIYIRSSGVYLRIVWIFSSPLMPMLLMPLLQYDFFYDSQLYTVPVQ